MTGNLWQTDSGELMAACCLVLTACRYNADMTDQLHDAPCPCCSGINHGLCCAPLHAGQPAPSPQALMRSRYSAFALGDTRYLLQSWHPDTRPDTLTLDASTAWRRLDIISASTDGTHGEVRFVATQQHGNQWHQLAELSRFTRVGQHWLYYDGDCELRRLDPGRNMPCPCGSGRKFKHCCG